jgi:hypothetical protein
MSFRLLLVLSQRAAVLAQGALDRKQGRTQNNTLTSLLMFYKCRRYTYFYKSAMEQFCKIIGHKPLSLDEFIKKFCRNFQDLCCLCFVFFPVHEVVFGTATNAFDKRFGCSTHDLMKIKVMLNKQTPMYVSLVSMRPTPPSAYS